MPRFVLGAEHAGERLDKVLAALVPDTSRATLQRWITEDRVRVDGRPCRGRDRVKAGALVDVEPGPRPPTRAEPDPTVPFEILHEDQHLVVVDKPAGVVVHPAKGHWRGTLVSGLLARLDFAADAADPRDAQGSLRPGIVHRIDKDTSGLLVVARDELTREGLKQQFSSHTIERVYTGLVLGVPRSARISTLYGRDPRSRVRFSSRVSEGRNAVTMFEVVEELASSRVALVRCRLETGRTHQIRVHLAEQANTPIFADALYGRRPADDDLFEIHKELGRHALHAEVLGFVHPITKQKLRFQAPPPAEFARALERLRSLGRAVT
jgi:23S rRNA pseudouridine1911/1915/1917 synthase